MNYLVLNGSPKGDKSVTMIVTKKFLDGIRHIDKKANIKVIDLVNMNIQPCRSCYACWSHLSEGECILTKRNVDDMSEIMKYYYSADKMILSTPMHFFNISSYLLKFLERTLPLIKPNYLPPKEIQKDTFRDMSIKDVAVISTGKFYFEGTWDCIDSQMRLLSRNKYQQLFSTQPIITCATDKEYVESYLQTVYKAGCEFAQNGVFTETTLERLKEVSMMMSQNVCTYSIPR